jgi:hypothetical protein
VAEGLRIFPNPVRTGGTIRLALARPGRVRVQVLDPMGRVVRTLADREAPAGRLDFALAGTSDDGRPLRTGFYFVRVQAPDRTALGRFLFLP